MSETKPISPGNANFVVTNDKGRPFAFRLIFPGDKFGNSAIWEWEEPGVEIYDATYAGDERFQPEGQVISQWFLRTLLEDSTYLNPYRGFILQGGVPEWELDAEARETMLDILHAGIASALSSGIWNNKSLLEFAEKNAAMLQPYHWLAAGSEVEVHDTDHTGIIERFDVKNGTYQVRFHDVPGAGPMLARTYHHDEVRLAADGALNKWDVVGELAPLYSPENRDFGDRPITKRDFIAITQGNEEHAKALFVMVCGSDWSPHPATVWDEIGGVEFFSEDKSSKTPTTKELIQIYGVDGEHPEFPASDWKYEVDNGDTRRGYWDWVAAGLEQQADDAGVDKPGMKG